MSTFEITSEIYSETDFDTVESQNGKNISKFHFKCIPEVKGMKADNEGDLIVSRIQRSVLEIEHSRSTVLKLVGLQIWRGAFLLADFIISQNEKFKNKNVLELASGVGLTGIVAGFYAKTVVFSDLDIGGILNLIESNVRRNKNLISTKNIEVLELDFCKNVNWSSKLVQAIQNTNIFIAADVIYDDELTDAFIATVKKLFELAGERKIEIYIALEKRYVFTIADMDTCAPCYEYFLKKLEFIRDNKNLKLASVPLDFAQYFEYERNKALILWKINN